MYKCKYCNGEFDNRFRLAAHVSANHPSTEKSSLGFKCRFCDRYFPSIGARNSHEGWKHKELVKIKKICEVCGAVYFVSRKGAKTSRFCSVKCRAKGTMGIRGTFKCDICGKVFETQAALNSHRGLVHLNKDKKYICPICGEIFSKPASVGGHVTSVHKRIHSTTKWRNSILRGKNHPFYGKHHTKEAIEKNRQKHLGKRNPNYGKSRPPEVREKIRKSNIKAYKKPEVWKNWLRGTSRRPTTPERRLIEIIEKHKYPLTYVGNGKFNVENMCPDFVHLCEKKVVEVFGNYWHDISEAEERVENFRKYGYQCLIIWENEIYDNEEKVIKNLEAFLGG